jgi:hypothetical protein
VAKALSDDHATEADLIPSARRTIERIRKFLVDKKIVTIPSEVRPTVAETPPYARNGSFASMDTAGAYETRATEAFYRWEPVTFDSGMSFAPSLGYIPPGRPVDKASQQ